MKTRIFHLFGRAHHVYRASADLTLRREAGVPLAQVGALLALANQPKMTLTELAAELSLKKPAASALVARMEAGGLVRRLPDPVDGRMQRLSLSAAGTRAARHALPIIAAANERLSKRFTQQELDTVARFLHAIIEDSGEEA